MEKSLLQSREGNMAVRTHKYTCTSTHIHAHTLSQTSRGNEIFPLGELLPEDELRCLLLRNKRGVGKVGTGQRGLPGPTSCQPRALPLHGMTVCRTSSRAQSVAAITMIKQKKVFLSSLRHGTRRIRLARSFPVGQCFTWLPHACAVLY